MTMTQDIPAMTHEARLAALGIALPQAAPPHRRLSQPAPPWRQPLRLGTGPVTADGTLLRGKVGTEVSADEARAHARLVAINILAVLRDEFGSLDAIGGVVKLTGLVNADPDFEAHPHVIDGASEVMHQVFGEAGVHARTSFGVGSLPNRITVEIEAVFELAARR